MYQAQSPPRTKPLHTGVADQVAFLPLLTRRQRQVLQAVARGLTNQQIADRLGIAHTTVKWHLGALMAKFSVSNRTELAYVAAKCGLA
ncbi:helix-turn-helix transcriptional regulator [Pseudonocardia kujensis]|uniref:response regulator transcription factor n=1 Tax=Pseudonocardia kujensis TaxID=1128675 RepID=UPI001E51B39F|nr:helix-turn-helix transcriptional regulator [Pseudonocardia kujensis]MCE0764574.1 helix-turn-helix transcriptional regulator [Pseudonocardia kujensis]